jgi:hypothetical protein
MKKILNIFKLLFGAKEKKISEQERVWAARNVWNDHVLAKQDKIYKGKLDES